MAIIQTGANTRFNISVMKKLDAAQLIYEHGSGLDTTNEGLKMCDSKMKVHLNMAYGFSWMA